MIIHEQASDFDGTFAALSSALLPLFWSTHPLLYQKNICWYQIIQRFMVTLIDVKSNKLSKCFSGFDGDY